MADGAEKTRHDLIEAAKSEFAQHGLAGARVDRIAAAAGVNKQRIYGHFGNKDGMFDAVLAQAMVEAAADKPLEPGASPADYAAQTFDFHRDHPALLRLLLFEALSRPVDTALADSERQRHYDQKVQAFVAAGFDEHRARQMLYAVLALTTYSRTMPQVAAFILDRDHTEDDLRSAIVDMIAAIAGSLLP